MSTLRGSAALLMFAAMAFGLVGPTACQPPAPELPQAPDTPEPPSEANNFLPKGGNCCIRNGPLLQSKCNGEGPCCAEKLDEDKCEKAKGVWFFTPEGCAGAC
ncbi:MAG TPA: hypothetical protein VL400_26670 [Polyangiaceae bacterium]|nr:hypothetical protein [Polyangiaceae bacterium]